MVGASTPSSPPGYNAFFSTPIPGQGHNGGSAIFVRRDIPTVPIQITSSLQAVAVKIYIDKFYTVCSLYLPPVQSPQKKIGPPPVQRVYNRGVKSVSVLPL